MKRYDVLGVGFLALFAILLIFIGATHHARSEVNAAQIEAAPAD